ncbi:hypothetical protein KC19_3G153200 [Ceratodon purpureus]|uniref:Uncharacterized protein n=1 Tax=Ceratodon purpureus TaxID=3225 RepID=A0A8T0IIN3_CERPU|nr:hypothetical protein KC19_3G153200 [Ceratodon purpureus]
MHQAFNGIMNPEDERWLLSQERVQVTSPRGVNLRFLWFCNKYFFLRSPDKLRACTVANFRLRFESGKFVLRFTQASCNSPVDCSDSDVIDTYKLLISKRPFWPADKCRPGSSHPLFLTPRQGCKFKDNVWFISTPVGKNTLRQYRQELFKDFAPIESCLRASMSSEEKEKSDALNEEIELCFDDDEFWRSPAGDTAIENEIKSHLMMKTLATGGKAVLNISNCTIVINPATAEAFLRFLRCPGILRDHVPEQAENLPERESN